MRYLKTFESVDRLYTPILYAEYITNRSYIPWTTKEVSDLDRDLPLIITSLYDSDSGLIVYKRPDKMGADMSRAVVRKLPDEYYLMIYKGSGYKCDQWEGLIQCIKDKVIE